MATSITFTLNEDTNLYEYSYTSDGKVRVFQIEYDGEDPAVSGKENMRQLYFFTTIDADTLEYAPIAQLDCSQNFNRSFRVDVYTGIGVKISSPLPISAASYIEE